MKIIPSQDHVVIEPIEKQEMKTDAGIILTAAAQNEASNVQYARVVSVGPGLVTSAGERVALPYEEGDYVVMMTNVPACVIECREVVQLQKAGSAPKAGTTYKAKIAIVKAQFILGKVVPGEGETVRFTSNS